MAGPPHLRPPGGVPGSLSRSSPELRPPPPPAPSPVSRLRATLAGKEAMHFAGPEGRAVRRGPEFPKCPEPFPWLRRLPAVTARGPTCPRAAGPSRSRTRGAAPPPAGRAPVSRAAEAAPRPARARCPAALTWPPAPTGRARPETREARPPPVAGPPARPRSPPPARARPCARRAPGAAWEAGGWGGVGGFREHARARGAGGGRGGSRLGRVRQSWRAARRPPLAAFSPLARL